METETTIIPKCGGTRAEHLAWCKARAHEYLKIGDTRQAYTSMASDLGKHPDTAKHSAITLGMMLLMSGKLTTVDEMTKFIDGFN